MKSASLFNQFPLSRTAAVLLLAGGLGGCGTEVISYNRQFREQGMSQYGQAAYADAASSFHNALRQEPGDYTSRYYLGECEEKMSKLQQAIEDYRTTLQVMDHSLEGRGDRPFRAKVIDALASAIAREPDHSGDLSIIERQPRTPETALLLAKIYRQTGDADGAINCFEQAQHLDTQDAAIAKDYGLYLEQLGQTQRAETQLRRAYALNTKDEEVAAALRRLGIVPGPSLLQGDAALAKPALPLGPLPEVDLSTSSKQSQPQGQPGAPGAVGSSSSPRD